MSFGLSPSYGLLTAREAHEWFLDMLRDYEQFEDEAGEWTVRGVMVVQ